MSEQLALALAGGGIGFIAAVFLCIANLLQTPQQLILGTKPFWDYNLDAMRSVASQRSHALVGGLLLAVAFLLEICAALAPASVAATLPQTMQSWPSFLVVVLVPSALLAAVAARLLTSFTVKKALRIYKGAA